MSSSDNYRNPYNLLIFEPTRVHQQTQFLGTFSRGTPPTSYREPPLPSPFPTDSSDTHSLYDPAPSPNKEAGSVRGKRDSASGSGGNAGQGIIISGPESLAALVVSRFGIGIGLVSSTVWS